MNDQTFWPGTKMLRTISRRRDSDFAADEGAATAIDLLNRALAIARVGAMRCERQYFAALRNHSPTLAAAALEHANSALSHAERIAERIAKLGTKPSASTDDSPSTQKSRGANGSSLPALMTQHLAADRATINSYREIATFLGSFDRTSQQLIHDIICAEEAAADHLASLLDEASDANSREV
jgi:bacterioferritin